MTWVVVANLVDTGGLFKMSATFREYRSHAAAIPLNTVGELEIADISRDLLRIVRDSGVEEGQAHLFLAGSTAALTTIEYEPGAVSDLKKAINRLAPADIHYDHDARWGDGNGRSHVRAALMGPSLTVPVRKGVPLLGTWQQVVLVELDTRGRSRTVHVTVTGSAGSSGS